MSGWQRIGVVISLLWLIGLPIYLMVDTNHQAGVSYEICFSSAVSQHGSSASDLKAAEEECSESSRRMLITPQKLLQLLMIGGNYNDGVAPWLMVLAPIIVFWILGGVIFATVRWVRSEAINQRGNAKIGKVKNKVAKNETLKLKVTFYNNLSVWLILGGFIIPYIVLLQQVFDTPKMIDAIKVGTMAFSIDEIRHISLAFGSFFAAIGMALYCHFRALKLIARLEP